MLSKCSHSSCSASFHHLGEGRLFRLDKDIFPSTACVSARVNRGEYYWLCNDCSAAMTLGLSEDGTVISHPLPRPYSGQANEADLVSLNRQMGLVLRRVRTYWSKN